MAFSGKGSGAMTFDNVRIGYDNNGDGDIDDAGDEIVRSETFGGTTCTVKHDDAGNMVDDGVYQYIYDAWNRLVKVKATEDGAAVTIQTAEFDATGRRIKKVVTNSGGFDDVVVYLYDGQKICETRNGSGNMVQQFIHGTQYIDELVMVRVAKKGDLYVHQDANWNVIGATDLAGSVVEAYTLSPYGELTVDQETGFGDRDGDGDVDATDKGTPGTDCTGTVTGACRVLDLDFDGDYDSADATEFDFLPQGSMIHPGRIATNVDQPFGHQGLLFDAEIGSYQNRARQYDQDGRRFLQRDELGASFPRGNAYVDGLNVYQYVRSQPTRRTDSSGRASKDCKCPGSSADDGWTMCDFHGNPGQPWCFPCVNQTLKEPFYTCSCAHEGAHCFMENNLCDTPLCAEMRCGEATDCDRINACLHRSDCGECAAYGQEYSCYTKEGSVTKDTSYSACMADCISRTCPPTGPPDTYIEIIEEACPSQCGHLKDVPPAP